MNVTKSVFLAVVLSLYATMAFAIEPIPKESGFGGFVSLGVGGNRIKNNMIAGNVFADVGKDRIRSLAQSPDSESTAMPSIGFELKYTFADTGTQLYLGNALEDMLRFDLTTQLGVRQDLEDYGIVAAAFVFNGIATEVWKDPYNTTQKRKETDRTANGVRFIWDKIMGSDLQIQYTARKIEIDKERSGVSLGLTNAETKLLRREGDFGQAEILYRFKLADKQILIPSFVYTKDDLDGDAMSSDTYDFQLTYSFTRNKFNLIANGFVGRSECDEKNPIFSKKQEDDRYGGAVRVSYRQPFGWQPFGNETFNVWGSVAFYRSDANINFYEQEALVGAMGALIRF